MISSAYRHSCSAKIGTAVPLLLWSYSKQRSAYVSAIARVCTPEVGITVVVERVPWIVPSVDPSKVLPDR